jgi:hypothetical protein
MTPEILLILSLIDATVPHEPIRSWITDPIAKGRVQPKTCFVNEIIHVTLDAAVVVAAKDHPLPAGDKDPSREVNRAYPAEPARARDMSRAVVDRFEHTDGC